MIDKFNAFPSGNIRNRKGLFINVILGSLPKADDEESTMPIIDTTKDEN
jgi:hypothetical protein